MHSKNYVNSVGKVYNFLTILEEIKDNKVKVRCICGQEKISNKYVITSGRIKSCGCKRLNLRRNTIIDNMVGKRFGRWTIIAFDSICNKRTYNWLCKCDCGTSKIIANLVLKRGESKSCGCLKNEIPLLKNPGETSFNSLFYNYKRNAEKRDIPFNMSKEDFKLTTSLNCFYCNDPPSQIISKSHSNRELVLEHSKYIYNGIDRINSNLGYSKSNIVACCWKCNVAKNDMDVEEFKNRVIRINSYNEMVLYGDQFFSNEIDNSHYIKSGIGVVLCYYKRNARYRGVSFKLNRSQFYMLNKSNCFYCGDKPYSICRKYVFNGVDRVNNELGYIINNVVPCCKRCNVFKGSMSIEEFKNHVSKIYINWASNNIF
jgi:5-methylcytosine-specific restriction endonuclease McrA